MGLIAWFKEKIKMLFKTDTEKAFGVETYLSPEMENAIKLWGQMESGKPPWLKESDGRTVSFSNTVARELAKLVTQNIDIKVQKKAGFSSSEKANFIQKAIDDCFMGNGKAQEVIERVIRLGGVMAKWDGEGIEFLPPDRFLVTEYNSNGEITGVIFLFFYQKEKKFYTRAEWHRFEDAVRQNDDGTTEKVRAYRISNKAFVSDNPYDIGRPTDLKKTKWADILPEYPKIPTDESEKMKNLEIEKPLFAYIKNPHSNTVDPDSPLGVSLFSECIEELRWLDIAMSTMGTETENSAPMMIVDQSVIQYADAKGIKLPKFIANTGLNLSGDDSKPVEQWQPQLQVTSRTEGINFYLNVLAMKTGFSEGYFTFNEKSGLATATQVEADERRTINTMMMYRQILDRPNSNGDGRVGAIHDIARIIDTMSAISKLNVNENYIDDEFGNYELFANFSDPFQNTEEDRKRAYQLMIQGIISRKYYLVHYEGFTEDDAIKIMQEATKERNEQEPEESRLFGDE